MEITGSQLENILEVTGKVLGVTADLGFTAILWLILFLLLALGVGIATVIICGKKKLFKRDKKVWNIIVKVYFAYVPLVLAIFGGIIGFLYGLNRSVVENFEEKSAMIIEASLAELPDFQSYIAEYTDIYEKNYNPEVLVDNYFAQNDSIDRSYIERLKIKVAKWVFTAVVDALVESVVETAANNLGIEEDTVVEGWEALHDIDASKLDNSLYTIITDSIIHLINKFFMSLYWAFAIKLLIFLSVPALETIISVSIMRRKQAVN